MYENLHFFSHGLCCKLSHKSQNTPIRVIGKAFWGKQFSSECLVKHIILITEENTLLHVSELGFTKKNVFKIQ